MLEILGWIGTFLVGFVLGLLGGGGSILIVPVLVYLFRFSAEISTSLSLVVVGHASAIGLTLTPEKNEIHWPTAIAFAIPSGIGAFFARRFLFSATPDPILGLSKDAFLLVLFAGLMLIISVRMIRPDKSPSPTQETIKTDFLRSTPAGLLVGTTAGYLGAGEACIIDPNRDLNQYIAAAQAEGLRITKVTETHIHADYLSGSQELAEITGAELLVSDEGDADWKYDATINATLLKEGDSFRIGALRFDIWHTPGRTPEHITHILTDEATSSEPVATFTGDLVFVGDVGRPDLLEEAAGISGTAEPGARQLFHTLERFKTLPDHIIIWPAHGAGSACGKSLGGSPVSSLGYEKLTTGDSAIRWRMNSSKMSSLVNQNHLPTSPK